MLQGLRTVVYQVTDLDRAKAWYTEMLGQPPYFDEPFYVGFNIGGYELGLHPGATGETPKAVGSVTYWGVVDADAAHARLLALGATPHEPIQNVGEGIRLGAVIDPFGNVFGVIANPHFTPKDD